MKANPEKTQTLSKRKDKGEDSSSEDVDVIKTTLGKLYEAE